MKNILLKDFKRQVKFVVPVYILMLVAALFAGDLSSGLLGAFILSFFIIFTVLLGIGTVEYNDDRNNAYSLYEALPLSRKGIVTAKFLEILILDVSVCFLSLFILEIMLPADTIAEASRMIIAVSFGVALLMASVYYTGVNAFGMELFNKISIGTLVLGQGLIVFFQLRRFNESGGVATEEIALFFKNLNLAVVLGIPIFLFMFLLGLTIKIRRKT